MKLHGLLQELFYVVLFIKNIFNNFIAFPSLIEDEAAIRAHVRDCSIFTALFSHGRYFSGCCALATSEIFNSMDMVDNNIIK
jgi:hypothetical protein